MGGKEKTERIECRSCNGDRNHRVLFSRERKLTDRIEFDDGDFFDEKSTDTYEMIQCCGCDEVRLRVTSAANTSPEVSVSVYPERRVARHTRFEWPDPFNPSKVASVYEETLRAFHARAYLLCGAGLRAMVEAICIDQGVTGRNLKEKIDALVTEQKLTKAQAEFLHEQRFIGNSALHEMREPAYLEVNDALTIVEGLLNTLYVLPTHLARLRRMRQEKKEP